MAGSNVRGASFERQVEELLRRAERTFPDLVHVYRHPSIVLQNQEKVIPDFQLTVELPYERSHYFIECQDREQPSKGLLHKIQHVRSKQAKKTFIVIYPSSAPSELRRAFDEEGVLCLTLGEFDAFLSRLTSTLRVQPPLPDPDDRPDRAMLANPRSPIEEMRDAACYLCGRSPAEFSRDCPEKERFKFYAHTVGGDEGKTVYLCEVCSVQDESPASKSPGKATSGTEPGRETSSDSQKKTAEVGTLLEQCLSADQATRMAAFSLLMRLADEKASWLVAPLICAASSEEKQVRALAASCLGAIGDSRAGRALIPLLQDSFWEVRYNAMDALGKLAFRDAILPILECVCRERNFRVRGRGLQILEHVFRFVDDRIIGHIQASWRENGIDLEDHYVGFE